MKNYSIGQVGDFEIKQLRIFKAVVDNGGFSAAETELNISRSTISIHISNLETRLSLTLCKRGRGGFSLTKEGAVIYEWTNKLIHSLDEFKNVVNELNQNPAGDLKILVSDGTSLDPRCHFPEMISSFYRVAPDISLLTEVASMADIERMILNDEADIGFMPYHRKLDGLNYLHLYSDTCRLYCDRSNPLYDISSKDVTDDIINQFTAIEPGLKPNSEAFEQLANMSLKGTASFYEARLAMILSGHFIAFLPETYAQSYVDSGRLKIIAGEERYYTLGIAAVTKKSVLPKRLIDIFLTIINDTIQPPR